jgi:hypothetical protein
VPSPPAVATPGQAYTLLMDWYDETSGILTDAASVQLDITYGSEAPLVADVAGPFTFSGATSTAPDVLWHIGTGQYGLAWQVPSGLASGAYVATWTVGYGADTYMVTENFPLAAGFSPVVSGDVGYWTGSITYQPPYLAAPLSIPLGGTDASGVAWALQQVTGWDSPPAAVGQVIQRTGDHGGWPTAQFYGPRMISLTVWASAPSQALRDQARAALQQAVPVGITAPDLATFTYDEPVPKLAYVRRNASAGIAETYPSLCDVIFTIPLTAPDPRKYSVTTETASTITPSVATPLALPWPSGLPVTFPDEIAAGSLGILAVNSGTFETRPVCTVAGPITSPSIINSAAGMAVTFTGLHVPSGSQLVLDMDARQAFLNGAFTPADANSAWWILQPGESPIYMTGSSSAGSSLSMSWQSAYI